MIFALPLLSYSVAARLKVDLEAKVSHMTVRLTLQFLMEKPVDSVTTQLKSELEVNSQGHNFAHVLGVAHFPPSFS